MEWAPPDSPERARSQHRRNGALSLSIIVPALNEADGIADALKRLRKAAPDGEIVVVDGGSDDGTAEAAAPWCDWFLSAPRGRGSQMNAGAAVAAGDVLWFVHADAAPPDDAAAQIENALSDPAAVGGCFRLRFPRPELLYRISDWAGNAAVDLFGRSYGDHGIFCRAADFRAVGGYPDLPILEDAELYRALRKRGRMRQLSGVMTASPRRYERVGVAKLTAAYTVISALWLVRTPNPILARIYARFCRPAGESTHR